MTVAADLTLRERAGQINQRLKGWEAVRWVDGAPRITDALRREVDRFGGLGALYGVLRADPWSAVRWDDGIPPERSAEAYAAVQDYVVANGCGVPVLFVEEAPHGLMALGATTLPVNLALGAGMDAGLAEELGSLVAAEARSRGTHVALVSGLDVLRDPRWGRAEECFSEDPALAAALVEATVRGMQGTGRRIDDAHVAVVAKHLAGQGAGIGGRNGSGAPIGRRELGEIHLRPAFAAARAGVAGFMSAYNDIDGVPCTANADLLTGTLRERWGWDGVVMADGTAVDRLRDSAPDPAHAATLALSAGVDLSLWDEAFTRVEEAVDRGILDEAVVTRAAARVLALKERVGLIGEPAPAESAPARDTATIAARAAAQSIVMVHNRGALPIARDARIALVGPNADDLDAQLGDYTPPRPASDPGATAVRSALTAALGADRVRFAAGSAHRSALAGGRETARAALADADVAVVVLGGTSRRHYDDEFADNGAVDGPAEDTTNGEGVDLARLGLPEPQLALLRDARASGLPVVAVVIDGRPRPLGAVADLADALIVAPFPGPAGGRAIADALLTGRASGRLPATFPAGEGVFPVAHDERMETARGYVDDRTPAAILLGASADPQISLRVRADDVAVTADELAGGGSAAVTVAVTNSGEATSVSVPLYGRRLETGIRPRRRTLLGVRRIEIAARSTAEVRFDLGLDELGSWAAGEPVPVAAEVVAWSADAHDPAAEHAVVRIIDEGGTP